MGIRLRNALLGVTAMGVAVGCWRPGAVPAPRGTHYVITVEELSQVSADMSLFDAVYRLRPHFLRSRATSAHGRPATWPVTLYVDGEKMESIDYLRRLSPADAAEVRFFEPQVANARFARYNNSGGAIAVTLKWVADVRPDSL